MISFLVAMDQNNVIGYQNDMPWHLPRDLKYFKEQTIGKKIIMGRKTYESIGRPLPERENIVVTRNKDTSQYPEEIKVIHSLDEVVQWDRENPDEEFMIIGGGIIFKETMEYADRLYITLINETFPGDAYFPEFDKSEWDLTSKELGIRDENNDYEYYFMQYDRKK